MKMKSLWIVLFITMVVASCEFSLVHGRVLRPEAQNAQIGDGCEGTTEGSVGMTTFSVSSNNSSFHDSARSLAFRLTSGPSKRGKGH
ncbi:hypothetical protein MtrunA17_Chr1g0152911 [Medicago truncatula]|uniref:Transmembrane protein n=2 Tax=Medicago truncatula TaxID=3880 RepID=Q2HRI5_MEDTR|nr:hypothetical protein MtrDRAFT_AC158501g25v2 [Medicago truncatula]RHN77264.1 hypothetical protein MtrunA17_Chr1g0152911 [Medicago truncatula]